MVEDLGLYNAIVGRTWLHAMKAIPSTYHRTISYLTASEQVELYGSQLAARQCYQLSIHERKKGKGLDSSPSGPHHSSWQLRPAARAILEDREQLAVDPLQSMLIDGPDKCTYVSSLVSKEERARLQEVLKTNVDVFAWVHWDMTGISPVNASHKLNAFPSARPIRQRMRRFHPNCH